MVITDVCDLKGGRGRRATNTICEFIHSAHVWAQWALGEKKSHYKLWLMANLQSKKPQVIQ